MTVTDPPDAAANSRARSRRGASGWWLVGVPMRTYLYTTSLMHCMTVSLALDGAGLGAVWGEQLATSMLADAGFGDVRVAEIESNPINNYYIARK